VGILEVLDLSSATLTDMLQEERLELGGGTFRGGINELLVRVRGDEMLSFEGFAGLVLELE
jgi:hypothetical protein